ncbi:uncharacterized protein Z519_02231 [Cladophialophora bantiana CBS 173.52]|uniref:FCP1 homology domain-containing protein n=1 Tax=Cladophialophora bantiana (strain ATCC 10958 / CBS 173.52 / CDC B-1940 / NIH 8579) TaxID=1442370 RepID=A0A0D2I0Y2_CLAB1|nr:uncharacterized protein Z519_02231 [Cladophialophora bantiana CBS 173.52]KIW96840.1 hypothetical protein Z519_02231 [Cladophialophora bantiana CBS 173.52]
MGKSRGARYRPNHGQQPAPAGVTPQDLQPWNGGANDASMPDRVGQIRQGDYYDCYSQDRIDIYNAVDSWRSYGNDNSSLKTGTNFQSFYSSYHGYVGGPQHRMDPLAPQGVNAGSSVFQPSHVRPSHYTPYQPLRSVHNYARYPTYRVDKLYRISDGTRERDIVQQAQNVLPMAQPQTLSRYQFRERKPAQITPYSVAATAGTPVSSVEAASKRGHVGTVPITKGSQRSRWVRDATPPPTPTASEEYKRKAALAPAIRDAPQKLLVILDLNGTLLVRPNRHRPRNIIVRPGVTQLLDYLFQNHIVMVYSSTKPDNCAAMVDQFFHPTQRSAMAGVWARDKLGLNKVQYDSKVQVYKKLEPIWEDKKIRKKAGPGQRWDQSNTVLVDDSHLKGLGQPHNLLQIPEFLNNAPREGGQALLNWQREQEQIVYSIQQKLEELKWQVDVSRTIREWQTGKRQAPGVVDETVDQKALQVTQNRELSPTPSIASSAPSVGQLESSIPQQLGAPEASTLSDTESSDTYDQGGGSGGVKTPAEATNSLLDELEKEIDRNLNLDQDRSRGADQTIGPATDVTTASRSSVKDRDQRRSESPIDESVWADILSGHGAAAGRVGESGQKTTHARNPSNREEKTQGKTASGGKRQRQRKKRGPPREEKESLRHAPPTPESI